MACAGDVPTMETLAAVDLLRQKASRNENPRRQRRRPDGAPAHEEHPHGLTDADFDAHLHPR
jgi:xylulose-5-phosphate/fructose-6-phosphate phosphoketolase